MTEEERRKEHELLSILPGEVPEYLHFREADGSIKTMRFANATRADWERHLAQMQAEIPRQTEALEKAMRGEISKEELDRIFDEFDLLYGETPWERS
jgi:hypothetical protein